MGIAYSGGTEPGAPSIDAASCTGCMSCTRVCPVGCFTDVDGKVQINRDATIGCIACGQCVMACPSDAIAVTGRGMERSHFVALPPRERRATADQLEALLLGRRSIRHFTDQEVSQADLDRIVDAAAMGPMGFPPWEVGVVVFRGRQKVRELAGDGTEAYRGIVRLLGSRPVRLLARLLMPRTKYRWLYNGVIPLGQSLLAEKDAGRDAALYDAPAALLFHSSPYGEGADPHIACTCAMLQAEAMGLGTTMIGCVPGPLATRKDILRKYGIPPHHRLQLVLIIGHPAIRYHRAVQRQLGWVSSWGGPLA